MKRVSVHRRCLESLELRWGRFGGGDGPQVHSQRAHHTEVRKPGEPLFKRFIAAAFVLACGSFLALPFAMADSVDKHITELKSENPDTRAHAAYELGCG